MTSQYPSACSGGHKRSSRPPACHRDHHFMLGVEDEEVSEEVTEKSTYQYRVITNYSAVFMVGVHKFMMIIMIK